MANKVTFDYSKASSFIQEHEMEYMSELAARQRTSLLQRQAREMISLDGLTFRLIMIKKNLHGSRKRQSRSAVILRCCW